MRRADWRENVTDKETCPYPPPTFSLDPPSRRRVLALMRDVVQVQRLCDLDARVQQPRDQARGAAQT